MFTTGPDGEYFVDQPINPIPSKDTWDNLSVKELYEVKNALENTLYTAGRNQAIIRQLNIAIADITQLISYRESSAF